jgi:signal transduction histidine kinase/ActR/RegA family two-component response regulator
MTAVLRGACRSTWEGDRVDPLETTGDPRSDLALGRLTLGLAVVVGVMAVTAIIGWQTRTAGLVQWRAGWAPMQQNTAVGLIACSIALAALHLRRRSVASLFATVAVGLGATALFQYIASVDFGIDDVLVDPFVLDAVSSPGRMSPTTAICLAAFGSGVIADHVLERRDEPRATPAVLETAGAFVGVLAVFSLIRYLLGTNAVLEWGAFSRMAVNTALGFLLLAIGLILVGIRRDHAALTAAVPGAVGGIALGLTVTGWRAIVGAPSGGDPSSDRTASALLIVASLFAMALATLIAVTQDALRSHRAAREALAALEVETAERRAAEEVAAEHAVARHRAEIERVEAEAARQRLRMEVERDRLRSELLQTRRLESLGHLAGGIAHDFNNLLGVMHNASELLDRRITDQLDLRDDEAEELLGDVAAIRNTVAQGSRLINQLLAFAQRDVAAAEVISVGDVIESTHALLEPTVGRHVLFVTAISDDLHPVLINTSQLEQVIVNLAINAADAMPTGGKLRLEADNIDVDAATAASTVELHPGPHVRMAVVDTGAGIHDDDLWHVFEPFFSTKQRGTGLGLSTVHGIVTSAGGRVEIESTVGVGTTVTVLLPAADRPVVVAPTIVVDTPDLAGMVVLIVDDNELLRETTRRMLEHAGCTVLVAGSGPEAIALASEHVDEIHVLMSDIAMPEMIGPDVARHIRAERGEIGVVLMSGYADELVHRTAVDRGTVEILEKPFTDAEMRDAVARSRQPRPDDGPR